MARTNELPMISAASKLVLQGKNVLIINDGPLMGYGIEGAFKSKAGYELTREYLIEICCGIRIASRRTAGQKFLKVWQT